MIEALNISCEENLKLIEDTIKYLKYNGMNVFFDAEHFFDGFNHNAKYAMKTFKSLKILVHLQLYYVTLMEDKFPQEFEK